MKKLFKIVLSAVLLFVLLGACAALIGVNDTTEPAEPQKAEETQAEPAVEQPKEEKPAEPAKPKGVTMEQFTSLENGMTYEEVVAIIGEGEIMSETGEKGTQFYTVMFSWPGEAGLGSNMTAMFQGNKLQSKAQIGLE